MNTVYVKLTGTVFLLHIIIKITNIMTICRELYNLAAYDYI